MIELDEVWTSGGRSVRVVGRERSRVVVRDTYGWLRRLPEDELRRGFRPAHGRASGGGRARGTRGDGAALARGRRSRVRRRGRPRPGAGRHLDWPEELVMTSRRAGSPAQEVGRWSQPFRSGRSWRPSACALAAAVDPRRGARRRGPPDAGAAKQAGPRRPERPLGGRQAPVRAASRVTLVAANGGRRSAPASSAHGHLEAGRQPGRDRAAALQRSRGPCSRPTLGDGRDARSRPRSSGAYVRVRLPERARRRPRDEPGQQLPRRRPGDRPGRGRARRGAHVGARDAGPRGARARARRCPGHGRTPGPGGDPGPTRRRRTPDRPRARRDDDQPDGDLPVRRVRGGRDVRVPARRGGLGRVRHAEGAHGR